MPVVALLDGDIFCYEVAAAAEVPIDWGDGLWTLHSHEAPALARVVERIHEAAEAVDADQIIVALSDTENFRKKILPTYKANRIGVRRPMLLKRLKDHVTETFDTFIRPSLEGDDVLGILSSWSGLKGDKVIVSKDKDFRTIPGYVYLFHRADEGVIEITTEEADRFHLIQTLAGDTTDGYAGCPGIGMQTAAEILADPYVLVPTEKVLKSGPNKGETRVTWVKEPTDDPWKSIVSHYEKAGLSEAEALVQARVARILRASDYDFKKKEPILWTP